MFLLLVQILQYPCCYNLMLTGAQVDGTTLTGSVVM